jgi:hypothetical protein
MNSHHLIFVGFELTDKVARLFEACSDRDRVYLEDPAYLETIVVEDKRYVGKRLKAGAALDRIEDTARSVVSLLNRVNSEWKEGADTALVMAVSDEGEVEGVTADGGVTSEAGDFDYSNLVD